MLQGFLRMDPVEDLRSFIDATAPVQQGDFQADDAVPMSVNRIGRDSLGVDNASRIYDIDNGAPIVWVGDMSQTTTEVHEGRADILDAKTACIGPPAR